MHMKPALDLQLPGGNIDKCSPICLSVHRPSVFLSITNRILSVILKRLKISDCEKWFKYTASSDDMQIMRTATPTLFLDGIMPLYYKHIFILLRNFVKCLKLLCEGQTDE